MQKKSIPPAWDQNAPSPYQGRDLTHFPDWHNLIVWDAFFNNLTAGLMLVTALAWLTGPPAFTMLLPVAMTVALSLVILDLCLLIFDLGDPWRFAHAMRVMHPTSPLSVGVWGLAAYATFLGVATVLTWLMVFMDGGGALHFFILTFMRLFMALAIMGAMVVICYKGVVFSCSSQPGVRDARWLTTFMVADSLLMGFALYILLAIAFSFNVIPLIVPFITLIIFRCIGFCLLWQNVKKRARIIYNMENEVVGWTVFGFAGILTVILPFCGAIAFAIAAALILICGMLERYWLIGLARPESWIEPLKKTAPIK